MLPSRSPSVDSKAAQSRPLSRFPIPPSIANHRRRRQQRHHPSTSKTTTTTAAALPTIPAANGKLRVSTLGLGTWSWGNRFLYGYDTSQDASIAEAFKEAASAGVTLFDSADSYGTGALSGRAESLLGSFLNDRALCSRDYRESRVVAATKIAPYPWRVTGKMFEAAARASVARMSGNGGGGDSSNSSNSSPTNPLLPPSRVVIQLHWSAANYAPPQEAALWDGLLRCYDAGLCSAVGVSNFGPKQLAKISRFLEKNGVPLAVAQTQYSLLSCGSETEAAISASRDAGAVPLAYSPLALGMLSGRYSLSSSSEGNRNSSSSSSRSRSNEITNLPKGPRAVLFKKVLPGARGLLEVIDAVARETKVSSSAASASASAGKEGGLLGSFLLSTPFSKATTTAATPAQVAIAWCVAKNTVPIPGARTARDVRSHVAAAAARLPAGAVEELDAAARGVKGGMTKNVFVTK